METWPLGLHYNWMQLCRLYDFNEMQTVSLGTSKVFHVVKIAGHVREVQRFE